MSDVKHFLSLSETPAKDLCAMIEAAKQLKAARKAGKNDPVLAGKNLAMIFEKASTRTRVSFEVAITDLGGKALVLQKNDLQLGRGETVADTAQVLSRYVDAIMLRAYHHSTLEELAEYSTIPVINGLTDRHHPCQLMADILTVEEHLGTVKDKTVTWIGDGNNVCHSWMQAAKQFGFYLRVATPEGYEPEIKNPDAARVKFMESPHEAAEDADVIVTDTWVSMGDDDTLSRRQSFSSYQVNSAMMTLAKPKAIFMHCLPAHRGEEVTDEVLDGTQSVVFDEAENRLHAQKAILLWCLGKL